MAKRLEIDENLKKEIQARCGSDIDLSKIVAYKARIVSTEPIEQDTIYDGATLAYSTISDLAAIVEDKNKNITIQTMHDTSVLPIGRLVMAYSVDEPNGIRALYGVFIISTEHPDLIAKVDTGIIDEVSINFLGEKLLCSECGEDFKEADPYSRFEAIMEKKCPFCGKEFGKEGVHLSIVGVEHFSEVSLVTQGAAKNAKILDEVKQLALAANKEKLNLSLKELGDRLLNITLNHKLSEKEKSMEMTELLANLSKLTEDFASFKKDSEEKIEGLMTKLAALEETTSVDEPASEPEGEPKGEPEGENDVEVKAEVSDEELKETKEALETSREEVENLTANYNAVKGFLLNEVNKVLTASGNAKLPEEASFEDIKKSLEASKLTLAASIPVGGVALAADGEKAEEKPSAENLAAFKVTY